MTHGRKYGDKPSRPFSVWNGILEHRRQIGAALWVFLWCLDKITREVDGVGWCLGRQPIKLRRIAADLNEAEKTVSRNLDRLEEAGYIVRIRTPYGYVIGVGNSRKFDAFRRADDRTKVSGHPSGDRTEMSGVIGQKCPSDQTRVSETKKTLQDSTEDTTVKPKSRVAAESAAPARSSFEKFWELYPNKIDRDKAARLWSQLSESEGLEAIESLMFWKRSGKWDEPRYVPSAKKFLQDQRWKCTAENSGKESLLEQQRRLEAKLGIS